jgi:SH3 domain-containing YSC84-like protein 1
MNRTRISTWRLNSWLFVVTMLVTCALVVAPVAPAYANDKQEATQLVEKARLTLDSFMNDGNMGAFRDLLKKADGVFITPQVLKGAFIVGASGGNGVVLIRDKKTGQWTDPAFYTVGGASFGLQIGGQASEVILLLMSERGVNSLMTNSLKLGADAGVAAGPIGMGVSAATANLSADILSFSRSKGLYGGISLDGAVIAVRQALNDAYYGKTATPADIFVRRDVVNPQARNLIEDLSKSAGPRAAAMETLPQAKSGALYEN